MWHKRASLGCRGGGVQGALDVNCPFCLGDGWNRDGRTRQRRVIESSRKRKTPKMGRWWRQFGYDGPKYCQRCSEVFRDHIMRQKQNSAYCTREKTHATPSQ